MTETDGHHISILFLLKDGKPLRIMQVTPESQGDKYLLMRSLAHDVTKLSADAVIMIGEVWRARFNPANPYMRAQDATDREELLMATLVRKEGMPVQLSAKFSRTGNRVSLGETEVERDNAHFMFAPIYQAWGRQIPNDWINLVSKLLQDGA